MEIQEAIKIIRALANATDPELGTGLPEDSVCRKPLAIKALNRALAALVAQEERERMKPANSYRAWTRTEEQQVCEELRQGTDFTQIAKTHNRSVASILARLVKLGKIKPKSSTESAPPKVA